VAINGTQVAETGGTGNYTIYVNPYEVVQSGGFTKHFYIKGQRIVSKLGESGKNGGSKESFQFYYHPDHLGNSSFITDAKGEVYQHLEYFPFGETFIDEHGNQQRTPYLYNGKELDDETGLYYYGARYYDPRTSVWENVDPSWGTPDQIDKSPYAYVQNNPVVFVDPDGHDRYYSEAGVFLGEYGNENNIRIVKTKYWANAAKVRRAGGSDAEYYLALSEGSRFGFDNTDDVALSWGQHYNTKSVKRGIEFGSYIYRFETAEGDVFYTYSKAAKGIRDAVVPSELPLNRGILTKVADIHSHGSYIPENGIGNNLFSRPDKESNYIEQIPGYVATPNGHLQRWDPKAKGGWWRGKRTTLSKSLARDPRYK
jgi:RHS repeat-associated protein